MLIFVLRKTITPFEYAVLTQWFDYLVKSDRANVDLIGELNLIKQIPQQWTVLGDGYKLVISYFLKSLKQDLNKRYII